MDEPKITPRRDWPLVGILFLLALGLRVWQVATTEVPARDTIGYVRIAWLMEHGDWRHAIKTAPHHPGYPAAILAASYLVRRLDSGPLPDVMQHSAQLASSVASVLLILPMFYLGRALFDRRVGFWATFLFQCLPASGRLLADGLSESLFFLFMATALWVAVIAFTRPSAWWFAGVGLFGALAYLTRPEGGLLIAATALVLIALQLARGTRQPWGKFALSGAALTLAALLFIGPFVAVTGRLTTTFTVENILRFSNKSPLEHTSILDMAHSPAVLAVWWQGDGDLPDQRRGWALLTLMEMLWKCFFYVLWFPALLALWHGRDRFRLVPGHWVLAVLCLMVLPLLYLVAMRMGYLSERHALLILFCGIYWASAGLLSMGAWLAAFFRRQPWARPQLWTSLLFVSVAAAGLFRTIDPLHAERTGFREAGYWLAKHAQPGAQIDDPYTWASYYAGQFFTEHPGEHQRGADWCVYVVVELSANKHPHLKPVSDMKYVMEHGQLIQSWPVRRGRDKAVIVLYEVKW